MTASLSFRLLVVALFVGRKLKCFLHFNLLLFCYFVLRVCCVKVEVQTVGMSDICSFI